MITVNSILGLPWLVASTVPCIMHISAMQTPEGLQESRLTGLFTHILVLATCFALNAIKLLPLPVLYGVFLFMGLVALPAQQFWQRILLFVQQKSLVAETPYTKYVKPFKRIHYYTLIQLFFFFLLYAVKNYKKISIAFPLFILLCIPVRIYLLPKIFSEDELTLLDGTPEEIEEWILQKTHIADDVGIIEVIKDYGDMDDSKLASELLKTIDDPDDEEASESIQNKDGNNNNGETREHRRRERQLSQGSVGEFFNQRSQMRRGSSQMKMMSGSQRSLAENQNIEAHMKDHGLMMPSDDLDIPDKIGEDDGDAKSEMSDIIEEK